MREDHKTWLTSSVAEALPTLLGFLFPMKGPTIRECQTFAMGIYGRVELSFIRTDGSSIRMTING